jgi:hypothetical protein
MEQELEAIVQEIEEEKALGRISGIEVFENMLNQPALVSLSSIENTNITSSVRFNQFENNLPRPILKANTIQLVNANIPQCVANIPDTALVFWFYRLSEYSGIVPNTENLFYVRLLPSTYKKEVMETPDMYGFNQTFTGYDDLNTQLRLACANDVGYYNTAKYSDTIGNYNFKFLPKEISLTYNASINKFQFTGTNAFTQPAFQQWSSSQTYAKDEVVYSVLGSIEVAYKSLQDGNTGKVVSDTNWWVRSYVEVVSQWDIGTAYTIGRYVRFNNLLYKCVASSIGNEPDISPTYWANIPIQIGSNSNGTRYYRYLPTGYNDANVKALQGYHLTTWNKYALFETGTKIIYNGVLYSALEQTRGIEPPNSVYWGSTSVSPKIDGLFQASQICDIYSNYGTFPVGMAGQPFNKNPKRLFNSILGFTWNGSFNANDLNIIENDTSRTATTQTALLYNQCRPIPFYFTDGLGSTLTTLNPATKTQIYTADGYCNLVYSSIVYIYTNISAGSTLNTATSTGLLAVGTMNCGNLGISYFNPIINNPLYITEVDLYNISIELRDEFGDPYYITNNGVVSIALKLTYKNGE